MVFLKKLATICLLSTLTLGGAMAQTVKSKSPHSAAHKQLLANQAKTKDQIRLVEKNTFIDLIDDIEPEPDIYTEGWNSKSVNPFKESDVPQSQVIDVTGYFMPVPGNVTSNYGYRARFGRMHKGIDLQIKSNDTIYAAFDGKVRLTNYEAKGYGNYVILRHPNGLETVYGHLNKHLVKPDQVVKAGQPIGLGGSTGRSTGPHLHFETRFMGYAINPAAIFDFANHTTHTDTYTFDKRTYTQARNYAPANTLAKAEKENPYRAADSERESYTVRKGDTLSSIAKSYGLSATSLRKINGMTNTDVIKVGQVLKLK
ncbi:MAG: peptidoglycan DD-metalloendopeptidase family protein [Muribaculaceae bacterium]|nr:peptidoglycan DD-metalloendopeptidase family protein [Muribaculaceae bacterium]MDE6753589.1 peptidoglycan DD-metalloendopeptidase family protein [Muribaculaceae bacterium]